MTDPEHLSQWLVYVLRWGFLLTKEKAKELEEGSGLPEGFPSPIMSQKTQADYTFLVCFGPNVF